MKINVTYCINVLDLDEDEEFGTVASEDSYFVVTGLPVKNIATFWKKIAKVRGCSRRRPTKNEAKDGRLRISWNDFFDHEDHEEAKTKILQIIKGFVPDAKLRYRQLGSPIETPLEE
mgnify:FL=1